MHKLAIVAACIALAACSQGSEPAGQSGDMVEVAPTPEATETASLPPLPGPADTDAQALLDYWKAAVESGDYAAAALAWHDPSLAGTEDYGQATLRVIYGEGQLEGAAGSSYLIVPVTLSANGPDGESIDRTGMMTAKRVNNVPGASEEQLSWRIRSLIWD